MAKRNGEFAPITGPELRALREKYKLTQAQLAVLGRSSTYTDSYGNRAARRVQAWESGQNRIPLASWELIVTKLKLLKSGTPLDRILEKRLDTLI